ncbi:MAG: hypothetical protein LBT29_01740 [Flavobacteriaceae bacterium]|jgi:hypothetical protein|nr:hypothetical protein [Flavobacteriaceae bacterium]
MKKLLIITLGIFPFLLSNTCSEDGHHFFSIKNNSDKAICVQYDQYYLDTLWHCDLPGLESPSHFFVLPNSTFMFDIGTSTWENEFTHEYLQLMVMDSVTYRNQLCDSIRMKNLILHRYQLKLEDFQKMNWIVTYPPEN